VTVILLVPVARPDPGQTPGNGGCSRQPLGHRWSDLNNPPLTNQVMKGIAADRISQSSGSAECVYLFTLKRGSWAPALRNGSTSMSFRKALGQTLQAGVPPGSRWR